jgi:hypothetical protein
MDSELKEYLNRAAKEMIPKMEEAVYVMTILSGSIDPKLCLELGAAILLEKPLILLSCNNTWIPPKLRALADEIIEIDDIHDKQAIEKIKEAMLRMKDRPRQ